MSTPKNKKTKKAGFTLVELMVVMAIFLLMTGTLFTVNSKSDSIQEVENVSLQLSAQLRNLQNEALTGKRIEWPDGSGTYLPVCRFTLKSIATSYSVVYDKNCLGAQSLVGNATNFDVSKKKVRLSVNAVSFVSPRGEVTAPVDIIVTSTKDSSVFRYVRVNASGNVIISET